ncbi:dimethylarginine dimethylaminohydrolase family protein [Salinibacter altiplanensis]|uniref:dimethylarginine dimethylaminohydrolase family protein n=1 Tax=Salinibacter altiplanensis TaxID=1803181 RepID=UPI000C9FB074|nr:arginine deiminase-related protein [Salinibacter altiplanensis]
MIYRTPDALDFRLDEISSLPRPRRVVLTTPTHFDVEYVINPHMSENMGSVNKDVAWQQWKAVRATYAALDCAPVVANGRSGLPDMVFCANQTLPFYDPDTETRGVVLSRMHSEHRTDEVPYYAQLFEEAGYVVESLPDALNADFEGMGDALWHPGRRLLWGGYGYRTSIEAYEALGELLDVPIVALRLVDPDYYHLDTCLCPLDAQHALLAPEAFDETGRALIDALFDTVIDVPDHEARHQFACNAHCPDGHHVLLQEGCEGTNDQLRAHDFVPVELDTSEFMKSGGSVFCMKQMVW